MATIMAMAFNKAGVFASEFRPGLIEKARKEMERALFAARLAEVRRKLKESGGSLRVLTLEEVKLATRHLGALRTKRTARYGERLLLPGDRGHALVTARVA